MEISKTRLSKYALLHQKKHRDRERLFIVQGEKAVRDTMPYFETEAIIIRKGIAFDKKGYGVDVLEASEGDMKKLSSFDSLPDVVAVCSIPSPETNLKLEDTEFTLALDGVQDPGNMGTIIRTAHWFGIRRIYCSIGTADIYNPKVVQATMGSLGKIQITYCELTELFDANPLIPVYGLTLEGENLFEISSPNPGIIVMGSEGHGHSQTVFDRLTKCLTIPPANPKDHPESLNVSIATAITLSQLIK